MLTTIFYFIVFTLVKFSKKIIIIIILIIHLNDFMEAISYISDRNQRSVIQNSKSDIELVDKNMICFSPNTDDSIWLAMKVTHIWPLGKQTRKITYWHTYNTKLDNCFASTCWCNTSFTFVNIVMEACQDDIHAQLCFYTSNIKSMNLISKYLYFNIFNNILIRFAKWIQNLDSIFWRATSKLSP